MGPWPFLSSSWKGNNNRHPLQLKLISVIPTPTQVTFDLRVLMSWGKSAEVPLWHVMFTFSWCSTHIYMMIRVEATKRHLCEEHIPQTRSDSAVCFYQQSHDTHSALLSPNAATSTKRTHLLNGCFILQRIGCELPIPLTNTVKSLRLESRMIEWQKKGASFFPFCSAVCLCGSLCGTKHQRVSALFENSLRHFHT